MPGNNQQHNASLPATSVPSSAVDRNDKLLGFSLPIYNFTLLDYSLRRASLSVSAQLHGMFFLAESPWTVSPDENAPPQQGAELTCYRRNIFQISGSVTLPRGLRYIMTDQGDRIPILAQELTVSATESVEGNLVKIISVPWKTPVNASEEQQQSSNNPKVEREPPPIPLDTMMAGQDLDSDYATFPISWKRLQFRVATANNGRRKELQQHFVVRLNVIATLSTGDKIPICEVRSGPVIVRGRSPRNFQSRKDLPLSGSAVSSRKNMISTSKIKAGVKRTNTTAATTATTTTTTTTTTMSSPAPSGGTASPAGSAWSSPKILPSSMPFLSDDDTSSPEDDKSTVLKPPTSLPPPAKKMRKLGPSSYELEPILLPFSSSSQQDPPPPLYEYFPLTLEEWQAPVDAVYRPHVVHQMMPDMDLVASRGNKRYFTEDVF